MKKILVTILAVVGVMIGSAQSYFKTFGWQDSIISLYYTTGQSDTLYINNLPILFMYDSVNILESYNLSSIDADTCFLTFPKRICICNKTSYSTYYLCLAKHIKGRDQLPYINTNCITHNYADYSNWSYSYSNYTKPSGNLNIPYYSIHIENNIPKYRIVVGIGERTFYGCDSLTKITIPSTIKRIEEMFIYGCSMLDTVVFENTFNDSMMFPPRMTDNTWFINKKLTIIVPNIAYDTFYNYINSLNTPLVAQLNIISDSTEYNSNIDTIQIYDTITTYDTIKIYDTTKITIYDTIIETIYDTNKVTLYDTIIETIYDTNKVTIYDTTKITIYDTIIETIYDTNKVTIYDTIYVFVPSTSCNDIDTYNSIKIYPIPTRDYINVEYIGWLDYELYTESGRLLERGVINGVEKKDLTYYANGFYYLKMKLDNGEVVCKRISKIN